MADPKGFLTTRRETPARRPVDVRIQDWREVYTEFGAAALERQAGHCMDCGIPFCHSGCPLGNLIPEWKRPDLAAGLAGGGRAAARHQQLPRVHGQAVPGAVRERVRARHRLRPGDDQAGGGRDRRPGVGGGLGRAAAAPASMHNEAADRAEGADNPGVDAPGADGPGGAGTPGSGADGPAGADTPGSGAGSPGSGAGTRGSGAGSPAGAGGPAVVEPAISALARHVVIIGGGDTGADCLGTAHRQGAASVTQLEIMPRPPATRPEKQPWPTYPMIFRVSSAHEEGGERVYAVSTQEFLGDAN